MPAKYALFDIDLDEISFVDKGDNPGAHIVFSKRQDDGEPLVTDGEIEEIIDKEADEDITPAVETKKVSPGLGTGILHAIGKALGWTDEQTRRVEEEFDKRDFDSYVERDQGVAFLEQASRLCSSYMNSIDDAVYAIAGEDPEIPLRDRVTRNTEQFIAALQSAAQNMSDGTLEKSSRPNLATLRGAYAAINAAFDEANPSAQDPVDDRKENDLLSKEIRAKLEKGEVLTDEERQAVIAADDELQKHSQEEPLIDPADDDAAFEAMVKNADPAMATYMRQAREEQKADRERVAKMEKEREIESLTKRLQGLRVPNAAEMAKDEGIRKLYRDNPEAMEKIDAHVRSLKERAEANDRLTHTLSIVEGGGEGSAYAEATKRAEEKVAKGEAKTVHAARAQVYQEDRALQKRVSDEQKGEVAS